ncbi:MAG: type II secretion system F family protein [Candidatus Methylomirabilia bacterium]
MPAYEYRARDRAGKAVQGVLEAEGTTEAAHQLDRLGFYPVSIAPQRPGRGPGLAFARVNNYFSRVSAEDFILYNRQMATLIAAGLPFLRSLGTIRDQTKSPRLRQVLEEVYTEIESGSSFSAALVHHPETFSQLYISMIRAGEEGGLLEKVLDRLATLAEQESVQRARISAALRYPMFVSAALVVAFFILMKFVIPKFVQLYANFGGELPIPTRMMIFANEMFQRFWIPGAVLFAAAIFGVSYALRTPAGRQLWDSWKIRLPIFGPLFLKSSLSRFSSVFSALLRSGVPLLKTLEIAAATVGNVKIRDVILGIRESVQEGQSIAGPMREQSVFTPMVVQMVAIGEETGKLDEMLDKVSDYYESEVEFAIRNLTTAIEPLLIVVIGGAVLFLALAIFMPWWNVVSFIKK